MRRFKDIILKDKKFLKEVAIILIFGILVNAFCFIIGSFHSKAANISSVLPYLCQSENSFYNQEQIDNILSLINERFPEEDIYNKKFIISLGVEYSWYTYNDYIEVPAYRVYVLPDNNIYGSSWSSNSNFQNFVFDNSSYYVDLAIIPFTSYTCIPSTLNDDNLYISKSNSSGVTYLRLFGSYSPHTINNNFFQVDVPGWNYPVFTNSAISTSDPTGETGLILSFSTGIIPGEFTDLPPLEDILNNISNSWNNFTENNLPNVDSDLSVAENLKNMLSTLQSNVNNSINNLGSNIKSYFDNLQRKLTDTTNAILGGIHNGFATLNQNFKDFFGAKLVFIIEKLDYITQEFDSSTVLSGLDNTDFKQDFDSLLSMHDGLSDILDVSEPTEYHLVLHLGQINDNFISLAGDQEIDISFLHNSSIFRTFAWCIVVSGLAFIVASGIPSMLRGDKGD